MAYPQQRAPPVRNYGPPRGGGPPRDPSYDPGYQDYGYDNQYPPDNGYGYPPDQGTPRSQGPPRGAPRPLRGPPPNERPPPRGYDSRRDRRPPPPQDRMRPLRNGPMSPEKMGFDNPFPSVPPGGRRPPRGIEGDMAAMSLNGPAPPRPHTSNGNRRPPDIRPPRPGGRPAPSGYPPRAASAGRMRTSDRNGPSGDPRGPPPMPYMSRSATTPVPGGEAYPGQSSYRDPRESTYGGVLNYYGSAPDDPDMPNFDAIPEDIDGGIDETMPGLEKPKPKPQSPGETGSTKGGYMAYNPAVLTPPDTGTPTGANQFANAGFQFDLPGEPQTPGSHFENGMGHGYDPYDNHLQSPYSQSSGRSQTMTGYPEPEPQDPQQNPDALPHHPMPYRPGHDSGGPPAPVRQYNGVANNQPPAPVPQGPQDGSAPRQPVTQAELERLQQQARGNPSDHKLQLTLAEKLVEASIVLIEASRLDPKSKAKAREKYNIDAHKILKKLTSAGYPDAQFFLADCYGQGLLGLQNDPKEAFSLYHSAAKQNHAQAAYRVAVCCEIGAEDGGGTKRDPFKAVQWYKRAASLGDPPAMYKMGMILLKGLLGQARNPREGISWLKRAAERADEENPHALHELALLYASASDNDIVIRDEAYASQLFHQASELGYKFSQFHLGMAYEYGLMGCPVDPRQSIMLYSAAASQGEHQSELALSGWYLTGSEGILQQSDTEAYLWARKAAASGLAKAEYAMGYFTETGIGATANLEDAKRWYWRAAAQGFPKARERLEELKQGGARMQKTRLSRSAVNQQKPNDGDCVLM
ncbi:putative chitin synthase activator (Chs3) [Aspergillus undulatus]|uniref:putative chitin synthase activator (Chs3) n=1 Tax=Aspergillus undulatus TaxID=1810928 RepID=UPI003CCD78F5